jgi:uncharacterized membrane protein YbhN (UPF0104 family)
MHPVDDSFGQFRDAISAFGDRMGDTHLLPLTIAIALHTLSLLVRSGVWCGILRAAFPDRQIGLRQTTWAYLAGVGANAIAPLRGGDLVRIHAIRRRVPDAPLATVVATLVAETAFGLIVVAGLVAATVALGWLPVMRLPDAKAFEISFYARHATALTAVVVVAVGVALILARSAAGPARRIWAHTVQGLRILRTPSRMVRTVIVPQLLDWVLRIATAYALLAAFGIHPTLRYAVAAVVIDAISTALPFTPGGAGAQQGLLVFALGGAASTGQVLAYSIGAQACISACNVALGLVAAFALFGHTRMGAIRREARAHAT